MLSWPSEDQAKWKSEELACRTVPTSYEVESEMEFVEAECAATEGFCPNCGVDQTCNWSWRLDDTKRWAGPTAACRCKDI